MEFEMFDTLPKNALEVIDWTWEQYQPYVDDLISRGLTADHIHPYLADWTRLVEVIYEAHTRLYLATSMDTRDDAAQKKFHAFLDEIYPPALVAFQQCKEKLLESNLSPDGFEIPLRNMQTEAALFRDENVPLLAQESKYVTEYEKIMGSQTVLWEGQEKTIDQMRPIYQDPSRAVREKAWRAVMERQLEDRKAINDLWGRFLRLRMQIAANADFPDYRAYQWQSLLRFTYTPEDCIAFQNAIEEVVVPAALRIYERRREQLGVEILRPWDLDVDPLNRPALRPFDDVAELESKATLIFQNVSAALADYFAMMRRENLLDLENRKGKAPGGFCTQYHTKRQPFIFQNSVGIHDDVQTVLHESGHAFHVFETAHLPYYQQRDTPMEFNEVASMAMELIAAPYLVSSQGGFYSEAEAARARIEHLERNIRFWPYMAVVDGFQHWVYTHPGDAQVPEKCDQQWDLLWDRFMKGVDWRGFEDAKVTGWQRKIHIHTDPFYYVEYGMAQLGAVQVWANAIQDQSTAVANYRKALALGGTVPLPDLYAVAGARFAFDAGTLGEAVDLMEAKITELSQLG
jgi:oligoendopeptidase F